MSHQAEPCARMSSAPFALCGMRITFENLGFTTSHKELIQLSLYVLH